MSLSFSIPQELHPLHESPNSHHCEKQVKSEQQVTVLSQTLERELFLQQQSNLSLFSLLLFYF